MPNCARHLDCHAIHARGCPGYATSCHPHEEVKYAMRRWTGRFLEPHHLGLTAPNGSHLRLDHYHEDKHSNGLSHGIDYLVVDFRAPSHKDKVLGIPSLFTDRYCGLRRSEKAKTDKYGPACESNHIFFRPCILSMCGAIGSQSRRGLQLAADAVCPSGCNCAGTVHGTAESSTDSRSG